MSYKVSGETCLVQHPNVLLIYLTFSDFNTAYPSKKITHEYQLSLAFKTSYASLTSVFFVHVSFANILVVVFTRDSTGRSVLQKYSNLLPNLVEMINHCVFNTSKGNRYFKTARCLEINCLFTTWVRLTRT